MFGKWDINISVGTMPQKVATACAMLNETAGAEYEPVAYLGSQQANGVNHAVLAKQTILTGKDTTNVVLLIFNEKTEYVTLVNIERVVEGGGALGGKSVDIQTEIPDGARGAFDAALNGFVGAAVQPFALLATQVTHGTNYVFAATVPPAAAQTAAEVAVVTVNPLAGQVSFADLVANKNGGALGYAFTW